MATIYLVSNGCYSDYSVWGVYSTPELAEEARKALGADNDVDEYELDAPPPAHPPGLYAFTVYMMNDGRLDRVYPASSEDFVPSASLAPVEHPYYKDGKYEVWACDEQHAIKIANEKRTQLLAEGHLTSTGEDDGIPEQ